MTTPAVLPVSINFCTSNEEQATAGCLAQAFANRPAEVIVIDGGRVVQDGPPEALLGDTEGLYARLVAEEQVVLAALEGGADWRRWRIEAGRLVEEGR